MRHLTHPQIGKESLNPLYRTMDSYLQKCLPISNLNHRHKPSLVLCDLFLPGIQIAAHAHNTPLLLFSPQSMSDFFPMRIFTLLSSP